MNPRVWRALGWILAGLVASVGLAVVAFFVVLVVSVNSWGSNK